MIPMLGETIRRLRNDKGMSQKELSHRVGISNSTINLYETGERSPSLLALIRLSKVLCVSSDYLLGLDKKTIKTVDVSGLSPDEVHVVDSVIKTIKNRSPNP